MLKQAAASGSNEKKETELIVRFFVEVDEAAATACSEHFESWWRSRIEPKETNERQCRETSDGTKQVTFVYKNKQNVEVSHQALLYHHVIPRAHYSAESRTRTGSSASSSPFYPVPQTSELVQNNGKSIVIAEHRAREETKK